jgi:uncharacterized membrane protein YgcG
MSNTNQSETKAISSFATTTTATALTPTADPIPSDFGGGNNIDTTFVSGTTMMDSAPLGFISRQRQQQQEQQQQQESSFTAPKVSDSTAIQKQEASDPQSEVVIQEHNIDTTSSSSSLPPLPPSPPSPPQSLDKQTIDGENKGSDDDTKMIRENASQNCPLVDIESSVILESIGDNFSQQTSTSSSSSSSSSSGQIDNKSNNDVCSGGDGGETSIVSLKAPTESTASIDGHINATASTNTAIDSKDAAITTKLPTVSIEEAVILGGANKNINNIVSGDNIINDTRENDNNKGSIYTIVDQKNTDPLIASPSSSQSIAYSLQHCYQQDTINRNNSNVTALHHPPTNTKDIIMSKNDSNTTSTIPNATHGVNNNNSSSTTISSSSSSSNKKRKLLQVLPESVFDSGGGSSGSVGSTITATTTTTTMNPSSQPPKRSKVKEKKLFNWIDEHGNVYCRNILAPTHYNAAQKVASMCKKFSKMNGTGQNFKLVVRLRQDGNQMTGCHHHAHEQQHSGTNDNISDNTTTTTTAHRCTSCSTQLEFQKFQNTYEYDVTMYHIPFHERTEFQKRRNICFRPEIRSRGHTKIRRRMEKNVPITTVNKSDETQVSPALPISNGLGTLVNISTTDSNSESAAIKTTTTTTPSSSTPTVSQVSEYSPDLSISLDNHTSIKNNDDDSDDSKALENHHTLENDQMSSKDKQVSEKQQQAQESVPMSDQDQMMSVEK